MTKIMITYLKSKYTLPYIIELFLSLIIYSATIIILISTKHINVATVALIPTHIFNQYLNFRLKPDNFKMAIDLTFGIVLIILVILLI